MFRHHTIALTVMLMGTWAAIPSAWADAPQAVEPVRHLGKAPRLKTPLPPELDQARTDAPELSEAAGFLIDTSRREEVRNFYNAVYQASENIPSAWTGNIAACQAGVVSSTYRSAVLRRINYYRAMAGMPANVVLYSTVVPYNQAGALLMSANSSLSHFPPSSWSCYTASGANAAGNSNIALGMAGADAVDGYIVDDGSGNTAAGHRRWILYHRCTASAPAT